MSNAKIRARRRRRARRAWEKTTGFVYYYDIETTVGTMGAYLPPRPLTNAERQAESAAAYMRKLAKLLAASCPGMLQIHDCFMVAAPIAYAGKVADPVKERMTNVLRAWHKGAGFGMKVDADFFNSPKNGFGDPVNWDDMSD